MSPVLLRLVVVVVAVLAAVAVARWRQGRAGRRVERPAGARLTAAQRSRLGIADGPAALLFGAAGCAPCATVKRLLGEVPVPPRVEVDVADHLDVARALGVRSVPTLLVVGGDGTIVARLRGVPAPDLLRASLAEAVAA